MFSRATLDADQFTNGLAFFFTALVCGAAAGSGTLRRSSLTALASTAFVLAQCKSAYMLLPAFSLIIPTSRFGSVRSKIFWVALIILPGALASFAWMLLLKASYFHDLTYRTWSGIVVPDEQTRFVLTHPLAFVGIFLRTIFTTTLVPKTIIEFLGVFGPPVALPVLYYPLLALGLGGTVVSDASARALLPDWRLRILVVSIVVLTLMMVLTLLYLQWTRLGGTVIDGFNGRYLFPLAPLMLLLLPTRSKPLLDIPASYWLFSLGGVSAVGTIWLTWSTYVR
jgi:uncharacterized membrane protein